MVSSLLRNRPFGLILDEVAPGSYLCGMATVSLKVLKNELSEYVRRAAAGETVVVTDRGRVVAEIAAPQPRPGLTPFEERGVREGWLTLAKNPEAPLPPRIPLVPFEQLMRELDEDREAR